MSFEQEILNKMKITTTMFLNLLIQIKGITAEISKDIDLNDNNYFIENPSINHQFNDIFDNQSIDNLIAIMNPFINEIVEEQEKICSQHEYVKDSIDIGSDESKTIYYCKHCHVSRKSV
jgi:nitrate reductase cytochrome c-type subunit